MARLSIRKVGSMRITAYGDASDKSVSGARMARLCVLPALLLITWFSVLAQAADIGEGAIAESQATDASNKWFITVLVQKDCRICDRMISAFAAHPDLQIFVNTDDPRKSWANWNVCSMDDPKQAARFSPPYSDLKIKGYPTLLVQPPANGKYGSAQTIVMQKTGYDGNASKLAQQLKTSIERYAATAERTASSDAIANRKSGSRLR